MTNEKLGDPDCVCQGTGLICRLDIGFKPDPSSIAICDCVAPAIRSQEREKLAPVRRYLEQIRDLDEQTSDGALGSLARKALEALPSEALSA